MTSFFPDVNVWVALSVQVHPHNSHSWSWISGLPPDAKLIFSRFRHLGLLRLLTNESAMGQQTLTIRKAWGVYDHWIQDYRVGFYPEGRGIEAVFRDMTVPFADKPASKWVGDCYILAYAIQIGAVLVTFDRALHAFAHKQGHAAVIPT